MMHRGIYPMSNPSTKKKVNLYQIRSNMDAVKKMRNEVKKYIDRADEKVVKMMHAMLEVDSEADWWDAMPDEIKKNVEYQ